LIRGNGGKMGKCDKIIGKYGKKWAKRKKRPQAANSSFKLK